MITPDEIKKKALKQYNKFLVARLKSEPFFPLIIPGNKGKTTDGYGKRKNELGLLLSREKSTVGFGYTVRMKEVKTRASNVQSQPDKIYFETESDFLKFLGKKKEFKEFEHAASVIRNTLPELNEWMMENPSRIIKNLGKWNNLMKVCVYFKDNPRPGMYIRELPVEVHTKFIEENKGVLKNLLDYLLPEAMVDTRETDFEKRFGLKFKEPLVRVRILDPKVAAGIVRGISDLSLPVSEFSLLDLECTNVFIVENLTVFLSFPERPESIIIFGKGFAVDSVGSAEWLADKNLIYWGDIDAHGFQILSTLRSHFPRTVSMMMDMETFTAFEEFSVKGPDGKTDRLSHLTDEENQVFQTLLNRTDRNRLEQERISHRYAIEKIQENL